MRKTMILAVFAAMVLIAPTAHAETRAETPAACTGASYAKSTDYLYRRQAGYYMAAYESGSMTIRSMADRLKSYAGRYTGLDGQFAAFVNARRNAGVDFANPFNYVRTLADFLASVEVDTHAAEMCMASLENEKRRPPA